MLGWLIGYDFFISHLQNYVNRDILNKIYVKVGLL